MFGWLLRLVMVHLLIDITALAIMHLIITPVNIKLIRLRLVIRIIGLIHVGFCVTIIRQV